MVVAALKIDKTMARAFGLKYSAARINNTGKAPPFSEKKKQSSWVSYYDIDLNQFLLTF